MVERRGAVGWEGLGQWGEGGGEQRRAECRRGRRVSRRSGRPKNSLACNGERREKRASSPEGLLRAQLGEVVAREAKLYCCAGAAERRDDVRIDFAGAERVGGRDLREADEGVHERQLAGVVELEARNAFAGRA